MVGRATMIRAAIKHNGLTRLRQDVHLLRELGVGAKRRAERSSMTPGDLQKTPFSSIFPMFVPSLSSSNDHFWYEKGYCAKRGVFRTSTIGPLSIVSSSKKYPQLIWPGPAPYGVPSGATAHGTSLCQS